jgi:hypothetical protein
MKALARKGQLKDTVAAELQEFFYPIHYQIGGRLRMRCGGVDTQAIRHFVDDSPAGEEGRFIRRKDIAVDAKLVESPILRSAKRFAVWRVRLRWSKSPKTPVPPEKTYHLDSRGRDLSRRWRHGRGILQDIVQRLPVATRRHRILPSINRRVQSPRALRQRVPAVQIRNGNSSGSRLTTGFSVVSLITRLWPDPRDRRRQPLHQRH